MSDLVPPMSFGASCRSLVVAILSTAFLAACGTQHTSLPTASAGTEAVTLTAAQTATVEAGVTEMLGKPPSSGLKGVRALSFPGKPGIHVCGAFNDGSAERRFYIELRDKDGKTYAERGQIASDDAKKAKIAFVCRHHG